MVVLHDILVYYGRKDMHIIIVPYICDMGRKLLMTIVALMVCVIPETAQSISSHFNTIGINGRTESNGAAAYPVHDAGADTLLSEYSAASFDAGKGDTVSLDRLEYMISMYERYLHLKDSILDVKHAVTERNVHSYYDWTPRELTLGNLIDVLRETGLSNRLFVLAQALLETGNFTSRVCREYNNLFGLYDSKNRDYYRFARWEDSVVGYLRMIQYKYKGGNYLTFLKRIGYAEDPRYVAKVARIAEQLCRKLDL